MNFEKLSTYKFCCHVQVFRTVSWILWLTNTKILQSIISQNKIRVAFKSDQLHFKRSRNIQNFPKKLNKLLRRVMHSKNAAWNNKWSLLKVLHAAIMRVILIIVNSFKSECKILIWNVLSYLNTFGELIIGIQVTCDELSYSIKFKFNLNRLSISRVISPTNPALIWRKMVVLF